MGAFIAFATFNNRPTAPYSSANYIPPYVASPPRTTAPNNTDAELTPQQRQAAGPDASAPATPTRDDYINALRKAEEAARAGDASAANDARRLAAFIKQLDSQQAPQPDSSANYTSPYDASPPQTAAPNYTLAELLAERERRRVAAALEAARLQQAAPLPPPPRVFDEPVVARATGEIRYTGPRPRVAPLEIKAPYGANYYIKMVHARSGRTHLVGFVRGGSTVEFLMPVGEYEMKYAVGTEWYGEQYLFGPTTAYARADAPFNFTQGPDGYDGYTVELLEREGGNLETQDIPASAF